MHVLVCYDITSAKRRKRLAEFLEGVGTRVNQSVFECDIGGGELAWLRQRVREIISHKSDSVRIYRLCKRCAGGSLRLGKSAPEPFADGDEYAVILV